MENILLINYYIEYIFIYLKMHKNVHKYTHIYYNIFRKEGIFIQVFTILIEIS